jgi:hypothetical protein
MFTLQIFRYLCEISSFIHTKIRPRLAQDKLTINELFRILIFSVIPGLIEGNFAVNIFRKLNIT